MSGMTLADEHGQTLWVDLDALNDVIDDAVGSYDSTLEEMADYPDIWADELDEARDAVQARRATAMEIIDFIRSGRDAK